MGKIYDIGPRQTFTPLPTGDYVLTLKDVSEHIEEEDSQYFKKGDMRLEWTWEVAVPDEEPAIRRSRAAPPASWNEKSTFVKIAEALRLVDHERAVTEGAHINWDVAIGKQCMGSILKLPKEGKPGEWTDNIKAFSPMPAVPDSTPRAPLSNAIAQRLKDLLVFTDGDFVVLPENMTSGQMATMMREVGSQALTATAKRNLADMRDMASMVAVQLPAELQEEPGTNKYGLLQVDAIQRLIDGAQDV